MLKVTYASYAYANMVKQYTSINANNKQFYLKLFNKANYNRCFGKAVFYEVFG